MSDQIAIKVSNVSKNFVLPHERVSSVKGLVTSIFKASNRRFEKQQALRDISFEIKKGEFYGIVGRNGSGKSTLLKILAGIYQPSAGAIVTHGKLVPFIELGVGFNPELTGRENVYLNGAMLGFSEKEIRAMYDDIVQFAEIERFMDQKLKNYSSGMQVRLAFSMAVRADADILLVDEVLAVGDADFQRKCFEYFRLLKKRKKTVVFVSHDMSAVREFCDKALLIDHSEVVAVGKSEVIAQKYTQLFIEESADEMIDDDTDAIEPTVKPEDAVRWGEGQAKITKATVSRRQLSDNDAVFEIETVITAVRPYSSIAMGFNIKDATGEVLFGTNTQIKQKRLPLLQPGETCRVVWTCPNIMADGKHTIDLALHDNEGIVVYDWWEDALKLTVKRIEKNSHKIMPKISVTFE